MVATNKTITDMGTIDFDKFLASFITAMKECSRMRTFSIPVCIKKALEEQGLEYKEGEIVKSQRRVSAEAKENGYSESEDERIRKTLIENFKFFGGDFLETSKWGKDDDLLVTDIIAWLEKQGRKPAEWKQENREELTEFENAMMHIGGSFFGENAGLDPNDTDTIKEQAELLLELAPKTEWSKEDEGVLSDAEGWLDTLCDYLKDSSSECIPHVKNVINRLNTIKNRIVPQTKQEWSDEDEEMCQNILECLRNGWRKLPTDILKYESWLKSPRPHPRQWSEEDEKNSYHLKILLENLTKDNKYEFRIISDNDRDKYTTWLESIKQRYTWKPSDEQMEVLVWCRPLFIVPKLKGILESLINDLKKLKGE